MNADESDSGQNRPSDFMANESLFLAWIRTSVGFIAFGFVMERFSWFLKQMLYLMPKDQVGKAGLSASGLQSSSQIVGFSLIALGALLSCLAFFKFRSDSKKIAEGTYHSSILLVSILTFSIVILALFLLFNLI